MAKGSKGRKRVRDGYATADPGGISDTLFRQKIKKKRPKKGGREIN